MFGPPSLASSVSAVFGAPREAGGVAAGYLEFKDTDNPGQGDFSCSGSVSQASCCLILNSTADAANLCDRMGIFCRGFVQLPELHDRYYVHFKMRLGTLERARGKRMFVKKHFSEKVRFATETIRAAM